MSIYSKKFECKECGKSFYRHYVSEETFLSADYKKSCPECLEVKALSLAGLKNSEGGCGSCKHFSGGHWGDCKKNVKLHDESEYTLTWAIDNIDTCLISEEDHEDYGNDITGKVYKDDWCSKFKRG